MIDFRYHLVSLIAVFLAVALGIVIGTTALNGRVLSNLETQVSALQEDKRSLEDQTVGLQTQLDTSAGFQQAVAPALVAGTLTGRTVLLLVTSDEVATETVDEVTGLLDAAGATVSGTVRVQPEYSDPGTAASLQNYATSPGLPPGITLPETDDAGQLIAALLAEVLMLPPDDADTPGNSPPDTTAASTVLAGLSTLDVLTLDGDSVSPADYAVVLTDGAFGGEDAGDRNSTLVELVTALDAAGSGAVVAGNSASAGENGLVGAVRADATVASAVSTVDNVTTPAGQISTVLALVDEGQGTSGKYGTGEDTQPVPPVSP